MSDPAGIGHNGAPKDRFSKRKWAEAIFNCKAKDKPVGAVAMSFRLFHDMDADGRGAALKDQELADACGVTDRSVRTFKGWLVKNVFVRITLKGARGSETQYQAIIPGDEIPEKSSAIQEGIPENTAGNICDDRKTLPEIEIELPEIASGVPGMPENISGNPSRALRACAYKELPSEVLNIQVVSKESEVKEEVGIVADATSNAIEALNVFKTYNELAQRVGLPLARSLTPQRRKAINARLKEHGGAVAWEAVLSNIARSAFLQGRNDRGWRPTGLDWFLNPANFTKVYEGAYGNGAHAYAPMQPKETEWERMSRLMGDPVTTEMEILPPMRRS